MAENPLEGDFSSEFRKIDIFAEFLPVIQTCNFYVNNIKVIQINSAIIEENRIILKDDDGKTLFEIYSRGISFKPDSLSALEFNNNWISFRVQTDDKARLISSIVEGLATEIGFIELENEDLLMEKVTTTPVHLECKSCHSNLSKTMTIKKVCALPSLDWDSASEGWFCHLEQKDKESLKKSNMIPKIDECFYSEFFCMLNRNNILVSSSNSDIICQNCNAYLGVSKDESFSIWSDCVYWISNGQVLLSQNPKSTILRLISNLEKDSFGINARLVLQKNTVPKKFLFVVVMDSNLTVLANKNSNLLANENANDYSNKKTKLSGNSSIELKRMKCVKVLYKMKVGEDNESGAWVDDVNIHILPCSYNFFKEIHELLNVSTNYVPNILNNDLKLGFIMR